MIEVDGLKIEYGHGERHTVAVNGVSFSVAEGDMVAMIGPSGCGKTSILLSAAGLIRPAGGRIRIGGKEVTRVRKDVAFIPQDAGLLPWKTVRGNAELGLRIQRRPRRGVRTILEAIGLGEFKNRYPAELSEGMRRRVGIARALCLHPDVLLMDEPMANLDSLTREHIQDLILRIWHEYRFTGILVTHDIEEAAFLGREIIVLTPRPAKVAEIAKNPRMGEVEYRRSPPFYEMVGKLRAILRAFQ